MILVMTALNMYIEYESTKRAINSELKNIKNIFPNSLETAIWELNNEQIESIGGSIQNMPIVYVLDILSPSGKVLYFS